jgi:hypothetical protein
VVALGDGAGDSSAFFFFVLFFAGVAEGDASVEADVEVFFAVEVELFFLAVVDVAWVVDAPVDVVAVASSFFCD